MTAKEKLRERIEAMGEEEASETLRLLDLRSDPVIIAFRDAPVDEERWSEEDEAEPTSPPAVRSRWMKRCESSSEQRRALAR